MDQCLDRDPENFEELRQCYNKSCAWSHRCWSILGGLRRWNLTYRHILSHESRRKMWAIVTNLFCLQFERQETIPFKLLLSETLLLYLTRLVDDSLIYPNTILLVLMLYSRNRSMYLPFCRQNGITFLWWDIIRWNTINKFAGYVISGLQRCGKEVERDGPDGPPDFEDTLYERGRCCHGDHKRYVSKAENPTRYPYSVRIYATPMY